MNNNINFEGAYKNIIHRLTHDLPPHLTYHNVAHTNSVLGVTESLAVLENIGEDETLLLKTAALFHDAGFLQKFKNHEESSCSLALESLPQYGYSSDEIGTICRIIMATRLPQRPADKLEEIICDADLHYLGTSQYEEISADLYKEFKKEGVVKTRKEWQQKELSFLMAHRFFTSSAKELYGPLKEKHIKTLTEAHQKHLHTTSLVQDVFFLILGVLIAGFGLKGFLVPNHFFDGGITGISLLLNELYHFNLAYVIVVLNVPFIIVGYFSVSGSFAFKTLAAVVLLGVCLLFMPYPTVTSDKLLISIFGGVFLGLGVGLTMKAGCALDGLEVLALYTLKKTSLTITEIILGINILIFSIAAFKFGMETALYSVLTYFVASRMIDYVIEGLQAFIGVTIISGKSDMVKYRLVNDLGRGITVYKGERGFLPGSFEQSADCDIIFTVVTRMELRKLKNLVYQTDENAFVFASTIREASGGIIKRRQRH